MGAGDWVIYQCISLSLSHSHGGLLKAQGVEIAIFLIILFDGFKSLELL